MKKQILFYSIIGLAALLIAASFFLSQYVEYKKFQLTQKKAIQECIEKTVGLNATGFTAANAQQKCTESFSK